MSHPLVTLVTMQQLVLTGNENEIFAMQSDWRLDESTKATGRAGVEAARQILARCYESEAA